MSDELSLHSPVSLLLRRRSKFAVMFYDLNVPWTENQRELQRTVAFLDECKKATSMPSLSQLTEAVLTHAMQ